DPGGKPALYDQFIIDCLHVSEAIEQIKNSDDIESVILDASIPFGLFELQAGELSHTLPKQLRSKTLKMQFALMLSLAIAETCPQINEVVAFMPRGAFEE